MAIYITSSISINFTGDGVSKVFSYDLTKAPLFMSDPGDPSVVVAKSPCTGPFIGLDAVAGTTIDDNIPFTASLKKSVLTLTFDRAPLAVGAPDLGSDESPSVVAEGEYGAGVEFRYNSD